MTCSTRKTGYPCVCKWLLMWHTQNWLPVCVSGYLCDVYGHPLFMKKNSIFFNKNHILHRLDDLTGVITLPKLPSHRLLHIYWHAKLVTRVSVSGYLCDVMVTHSSWKKINFFNKNHILHRLDGLTDVGFSTYTDTHKTGYPCVGKWLPMWRLWSPTLHEKKSLFFNKNHILHRLDGLTDVGFSIYTGTHTIVYSCVCKWYLCDIYDPPTLYEKIIIFFNMGHITSVRWLNRFNMSHSE